MPTDFVVPDGYQTLAPGTALAVLEAPDRADVKGKVSTAFLSGLKSPCKSSMVIRWAASMEKQAISGSVADDAVNGTLP